WFILTHDYITKGKGATKLRMTLHVKLCLMTTCAVGAAAVGTALALAIILSCSHIHHNSLNIALACLDDVDAIVVSLLHAVGLVSAVAVAAG
ncbi:hypothetical protein, partial [Campylobacter fetus]|uniref:hypothetical protein n=1 Tax=Campylobacter fetus TaxID=196 RepID=UPI001F306894